MNGNFSKMVWCLGLVVGLTSAGPCGAALIPLVSHDWVGSGGEELVNSGSTGAVNDAILVNNGQDPVVPGTGIATVVNGSTPGPGAGGDDGYISIGPVDYFTGATMFQITFNDLDLDDSVTGGPLGGALAPGFAAGSQLLMGLDDQPSGTADLSVRLYEAGGASGGGDTDEVVDGVGFDDIIPSDRLVDLTIQYEGNGLLQAAGGFGTVTAIVDGTVVGSEIILIGILNPSEVGVPFGIGKYHNGSSVAGQFTVGEFTIAIPEPASMMLLVGGCPLLLRRRRRA